jgi:GxxExxY protein
MEEGKHKDRAFEITDIVRETGCQIHCLLGPGHLEKVYENALVNRLNKQGVKVARQQKISVFDEVGSLLGEFIADLVVEDILIVEIKAAKRIADEHVAQLIGYLRASRMEHGVVVDFGGERFQICKLAKNKHTKSLF